MRGSYKPSVRESLGSKSAREVKKIWTESSLWVREPLVHLKPAFKIIQLLLLVFFFPLLFIFKGI